MLAFTFTWNRAVKRIHAEARACIAARLGSRDVLPLGVLLSQSVVPETNAAVTLLKGLGSILEVPPGTLRADDRLAALFRVRRDELPGVNDRVWAASKCGGFVDIAVYDLMHLAEISTPPTIWERRWRAFTPSPRNEEEWIDLMLAMRLDQFLRCFGSDVEDWQVAAAA